jgi:hypothetical protein
MSSIPEVASRTARDPARRSRTQSAGVTHLRRPALGVVAISLAMSLAAVPSAGASVTASTVGAQLSGIYTVSFHVVSPAVDRRDRTSLDLDFTGGCNAGACEATVTTLAESCPSGSCGQPPSDLSFAYDVLRLASGEYRGTFSIKTGCTAQGTYYPYAYEQRTVLAVRPTAARAAGGVAQVTRFVGTLELYGAPDATGLKWGCPAYRFGLDVAGTSHT